MASRVISAVLKLKDQNFSDGLKQANKDAGDFGRYMQQAQNKATQFGQKANDVFRGVGVAAGALASGAIAGLGVAVGQAFLEMDSAFAQLEARTGATGEDLKKLEQAAVDVFKRGYGESLSEVSNNLSRVSQNMHNIDPSQLADVTAQAMLLAQTTDSDLNEVTRGAQNLMDAYGISADKAFDLFTKGAQSGLNMSNDMFDQMGEFSAVAQQAGYSAEELFGVMQRGAENGVYNLDRINNAILEFGLKTTDGNKATEKSFSLLSDSTQQMWKDMQAGKVTAKELSTTVIQELKAMDDQNLANQIGISMWGTTWEDNTKDVMYSMFETTDALKDFEGATDSAAQAVEGSFGNRVKSAFRDLTTSIASLADSEEGKEALDSIASAAESLVPKITSLVSKALEFAGVIANNWRPIAGVVAGATVAVVAFKVGMMAMSVVNTVVGFVKAYQAATVAGTAAQWAMNVAMSANPIGLVIAGISALIGVGVALWMNWDTVTAKTKAVWESIGGLEGAISLILGPIGFLINAAVDLANNWDSTKSIWENVWSAIKSSAETSVNAVIGVINNMIDTINKLPGVNVPVIAKVEWAEEPAKSGKSAKKKTTKAEGNFAVGSDRIPRDMLAQIHKDEMIIPARQAQKVRAMGGNIDNIDKLINKPAQTVPVASSTTNNQTTAPVIHMVVNANQLSYDDVVYRLSKDIKLALSNM